VTVGNRLGVAALALIEQGLWSAGFLAFTAVTAVTLDAADLADLALSTAIGLIFLAAIRAWSIDAVIVLGNGSALAGRLRRITAAYILGSVGSATICGAWLGLSASSENGIVYTAFAAALVLGDLGRYRALAGANLSVSISYASCYAVAGAVATLIGYRTANGLAVVWLWVVVLALLSVPTMVRLLFIDLSPRVELRELPKYARYMTLESVYLGVAGQAAIFLCVALGTDQDVTGLRLAYSLAFAPAGLVVQGLGPHVLRLGSRVRDSKQGVRYAAYWGSFCAAGYMLSGFAFATFFGDVHSENLDLASTFVPAVGSLLIAQVCTNAMQVPFRYRYGPRASQLLRLAGVMIDILFQLAGLLIGATNGFILSIYAASVVRLVIVSVVGVKLFYAPEADHIRS